MPETDFDFAGDFSGFQIPKAPRPTPATALAASARGFLITEPLKWKSMHFEPWILKKGVSWNGRKMHPIKSPVHKIWRKLSCPRARNAQEEFQIIGSKKKPTMIQILEQHKRKKVPIFSHHMQWFRLPYGNLDPDPWPFPRSLSGKLDENDRFGIYTLVAWNFLNCIAQLRVFLSMHNKLKGWILNRFEEYMAHNLCFSCKCQCAKIAIESILSQMKRFSGDRIPSIPRYMSPGCVCKLRTQKCTLPETNIAPENRPSQKESSIPTIHF